MDIEVKKERETPLLSRKRVTLMAEYAGPTPARLDMRKEIAKKLGAEEKLVIIKHVYTRFGSQKAKVIVHVYNDEKDLRALEDESVLIKHKLAEKKKEEAKAEAPAPKK